MKRIWMWGFLALLGVVIFSAFSKDNEDLTTEYATRLAAKCGYPQIAEKNMWSSFRTWSMRDSNFTPSFIQECMKRFPRDSITRAVAEVIAVNFTEAQLRDIVAFSETEAGAKVLKDWPDLSMNMGEAIRHCEEEWTRGIFDKLRTEGKEPPLPKPRIGIPMPVGK